MKRSWAIAVLLLVFMMQICSGYCEEAISARIELSNDAIHLSGDGVHAEGNTVYIMLPGTYIVSGEAENGSIVVYAGKQADVKMILAGLNLKNSGQPVIQAPEIRKLELCLEKETSNTLICGEEGQTRSDIESTESIHCVHVKGDLEITGDGKLDVYGNLGGGLRASGNLKIHDGDIRVQSVKDAIKGKDSVEVLDGRLSIVSDADGIQAENGDGEGSGYVIIRGGVLEIKSGEDGIQSETTLEVLGGEINLISGGGSGEETATKEIEMGFGKAPFSMPVGQAPDMPPEFLQDMKMNDVPPELPEDITWRGAPPEEMEWDRALSDEANEQETDGAARQNEQTGMRMRGGRMHGVMPEKAQENPEEADDTPSRKGMKSGADLLIRGGKITIDASDDGLHAGGSIGVSGGEIAVSSGDDGLHADAEIRIEDGLTYVLKSYEGLEAKESIFISGGETTVHASDDGINAGSGLSGFGFGRNSMQTPDEQLPSLRIMGGKLTVYADGDGLDSNGSLIVEGGDIIVNGPENGGNGALDSGTESGGVCSISGGTLLAVGSSGMAESFDRNSAQCAIFCRFDTALSEGDRLKITAADGSVLLEHKITKCADSMVFSCPALAEGENYLVTAGSETVSVTAGDASNEPSGSRGFSGGLNGNVEGRKGRGRRLAP